MIHELKCTAPYFWDVVNRNKTFELRKNDRNFKVGDFLRLREWDKEDQEYTGKSIDLRVRYILEDYPGLEEGYCILGV